MEWPALLLSLELAAVTLLILLPIGLWGGRWLAYHSFPGRAVVEGLLFLPLVLPPTVLGYYLLVMLGTAAPLGRWLEETLGVTLVFHFSGLVIASILVNLPLMVPVLQRSFEAIDPELRLAAEVIGLPAWRIFWQVELPLVWRTLVSASVITFIHTLGEFGVVLMVGGNIPGETRTLSIAIYDRVQAFDLASADTMAFLLLALSLGAVTLSFALAKRGAP